MHKSTAVVVALIACGCSDTNGASSSTIGPSGGTVSSGAVTLDIPAGALSSTKTITVRAGTGGHPSFTSLSPVFHMEPAGLVFRTPAWVKIAVDQTPNWAGLYVTALGGTKWVRAESGVRDGSVHGRIKSLGDVQAGQAYTGQVTLAAKRTTTLSSKPAAQVAGDFNTDGEQDVAYIASTGIAHVLLAQGAAWNQVPAFSVTGQPFGMAAVDLSAHGGSDLLVGAVAADGTVELIPVVNGAAAGIAPVFSVGTAISMGSLLANGAQPPAFAVWQDGQDLWAAAVGAIDAKHSQLLVAQMTTDSSGTLTAAAPPGTATVALGAARPYFFARAYLPPQLGVIGNDGSSTQLLGFTQWTGAALQPLWTQTLAHSVAVDFTARSGDYFFAGDVSLLETAGTPGSFTYKPAVVFGTGLSTMKAPDPWQGPLTNLEGFYFEPGASEESVDIQVHDYLWQRNYNSDFKSTARALLILSGESVQLSNGDVVDVRYQADQQTPAAVAPTTEMPMDLPNLDTFSYGNASPFSWSVDMPPPAPGGSVGIYEGLDGIVTDVEQELDTQFRMDEFQAEYCHPPVPGYEDACDQPVGGMDMAAPTDMASNGKCGSTFDPFNANFDFQPKIGDNGTAVTISGVGFSSLSSFKVQFSSIARSDADADANAPVTVDSSAHVVNDTTIAATFTGGHTSFVQIVPCGTTDNFSAGTSMNELFYAPPHISSVDCLLAGGMKGPCPAQAGDYVVIHGYNFNGATTATVAGTDLIAASGGGPWSNYDEKIQGPGVNYAPGAQVVVTGPGGTATFTAP